MVEEEANPFEIERMLEEENPFWNTFCCEEEEDDSPPMLEEENTFWNTLCFEEEEDDSPEMENSPQEEESDFSHDSDFESDIDEEEFARYMHQKYISDGFDVDVRPRGVMGGPYIVKDLDEINQLEETLREHVYHHAKFAVKHYNEHENANLEFVELVKVNMEFLAGTMYYITFEAKDNGDDDDGLVSVYQAKVWWPMAESIEETEENTEIVFCRKKPSSYQLSKGNERKHGYVARDVAALVVPVDCTRVFNGLHDVHSSQVF